MVMLLGACRPGAEPVDATTSPAEAPAPVVSPEPASEPEPVETPATEVVEASPEPAPAPVAEPEPVEAPTRIAKVTVWRDSKAGTGTAPWKRVSIEEVQFGIRPSKGETVTVLPLKASLPPLELTITRIKKRDYGDYPSWDVSFSRVTDRAYFKIKGSNPQMPADVVVVYPATPSATVLKTKGLSPDDLPGHAPPRSVELAVDVNGDGKPDTVELTVCTDNPKRAKCGEATAWETHRLVDGEWTLVYRFEPIT